MRSITFATFLSSPECVSAVRDPSQWVSDFLYELKLTRWFDSCKISATETRKELGGIPCKHLDLGVTESTNLQKQKSMTVGWSHYKTNSPRLSIDLDIGWRCTTLRGIHAYACMRMHIGMQLSRMKKVEGFFVYGIPYGGFRRICSMCHIYQPTVPEISLFFGGKLFI